MTREKNGVALPRVFVARRIAPEALAMLDNQAEVEVWEGEAQPPRALLLKQAACADGLLTMLTDQVDTELLSGAPRLRVVSNMAVGYDNIQVSECTLRGVLVGNTPGVLTATSAEFTFALLMAAARRVVEADRFVREGRWRHWQPDLLLGRDLHGATLGVVGLGAIGREVAVRARAFGMRVIYCSAHRHPDDEARHGLTWAPDLGALLRESDFVTLHVPLKPATHHMIGREQLRMMRRHAVLVNTARGPVVDQRALYEALRDGVIGGAALDVAEVEPMPPDEPLLSLPNVVVVPHIASATVATRTRMAVMAVQNLLAGLRGEPMPHCVNPEAHNVILSLQAKNRRTAPGAAP
ncbi:MAG: D-glycerate dehydrogenase [Dehalococcoidia bacterium]|nr:D-glycerate dehydrogenase [Dehalococcoidia bacterium]